MTKPNAKPLVKRRPKVRAEVTEAPVGETPAELEETAQAEPEAPLVVSPPEFVHPVFRKRGAVTEVSE